MQKLNMHLSLFQDVETATELLSILESMMVRQENRMNSLIVASSKLLVPTMSMKVYVKVYVDISEEEKNKNPES